jgi:hypothetical protein
MRQGYGDRYIRISGFDASHGWRDRFVDEATADRHRVGGMCLRRIALANGRGNAALRQADEAPFPRGAAEISVTGHGASVQ